MNQKQNLLLLIAILSVTTLFAQKSPYKFGDIDIEDLKMTTVPIDSTAGAVVLVDYGQTSFDHNFEIIFLHHIRIKIINSTEFDRADIIIPHDKSERVMKLEASTFNLEGGEVVEHKVSKKDMFEEQVNDDLMRKRFTFPNVREGSIIEYTYKVNYGSWRSLNTWYFQLSIPVVESVYEVVLPDFFDYKRIMTGWRMSNMIIKQGIIKI